MENYNFNRKNSGITLIALVVSIIVLLILAGISISMLSGENGILKRAINAKNKNLENSEIETIKLAIMECQMKESEYTNINVEKLNKVLNSQYNIEAEIIDNKDGSLLINLKSNNSYYIDENNIIESKKILEISSPDDLIDLKKRVNGEEPYRESETFEGWYIYLKNNIDLSGIEWNPIGTYIGKPPYNEQNKFFKGIFDGRNYEIDGLTIQSENIVQGLFGIVRNGTIKNLGIGENSNISGGTSTGGIVGYLYENSNVYNCYNKATITGNDYTGGVVGQSYNSKISNTYNKGNVFGQNRIGGICGAAYNDSFINCSYNEGEINGSSNFVGGITGIIYDHTEIKDCYNKGHLTSIANFVGGIAGYVYLSGNVSYQNNYIYNCYNIGKIDAVYSKNLGGIISNTSENTILENNYYLNETLNNSNEINLDGANKKDADFLKNSIYLIGENWKKQINEYPKLFWE